MAQTGSRLESVGHADGPALLCQAGMYAAGCQRRSPIERQRSRPEEAENVGLPIQKVAAQSNLGCGDGGEPQSMFCDQLPYQL
jgi:hypothetical protein